MTKTKLMAYQTNHHLHALNLLPQLGPKRISTIIDGFENIEDIWQADAKAFSLLGFDTELSQTIVDHLQNLNIDEALNQLTQEQINLLSFTDTDYPQLLSEIPQAPPLLYYRGALGPSDELMVAIVGTRKISTYGRSIVPDFTIELAQSGITIVSGLAFGVDALAHQICVDNNFRTIAVVGSGIDTKSVYPKQHQYLSEQIIATGGAIISEYPPGTPAYKQHFIARNRIISGMSTGTLVVEANLKSGALITARHALDQDRSVYAIPGPIYAEGSQGPHSLIRMGAQLVTKAGDILGDLNITDDTTATSINLADFTPDQQLILEQLSFEPKNIDEIIQSIELDASTVTAILTLLEMKGVIRNIGAQQYVLTHKLK